MSETGWERAYATLGGAAAHLATAVAPVWPALRPRLGGTGWQEAGTRPLWCHGASVGEMGSLAPVVGELEARWPELTWGVTTTTATGQNRARQSLPRAHFHELLPLDGAPAVTRAVDRIDPGAVLIVETEVWPTFLRCLRQRSIPAALVSARLTKKSIKGYRRFDGIFRPALAGLELIAARSDRDRAAFIDLGADPERVQTLGNTKLDGEPDAVDEPTRSRLASYGSSGANVVWGCLRPRDVPLAVACLHALGPRCRWVFAPRHPDTFDDLGARIARTAGELSLRFARWSDQSPKETDVLFIDALGALGSAYAAADIAVVGGTFHQYGGHNLMEPARSGVPVLFGPDTSSWPDDASGLVSGGGGIRVEDVEGLLAQLRTWLDDEDGRTRAGELARRSALAGRGASRRIVGALDARGFFGAVSGT